MIPHMADTPKHTEFARMLTEAREHVHMRQEDLAKALGEASGQQVSNWERGLLLPVRRRLERILQVLPHMDGLVVVDGDGNVTTTKV